MTGATLYGPGYGLEWSPPSPCRLRAVSAASVLATSKASPVVGYVSAINRDAIWARPLSLGSKRVQPPRQSPRISSDAPTCITNFPTEYHMFGIPFQTDGPNLVARFVKRKELPGG